MMRYVVFFVGECLYCCATANVKGALRKNLKGATREAFCSRKPKDHIHAGVEVNHALYRFGGLNPTSRTFEKIIPGSFSNRILRNVGKAFSSLSRTRSRVSLEYLTVLQQRTIPPAGRIIRYRGTDTPSKLSAAIWQGDPTNMHCNFRATVTLVVRWPMGGLVGVQWYRRGIHSR